MKKEKETREKKKKEKERGEKEKKKPKKPPKPRSAQNRGEAIKPSFTGNKKLANRNLPFKKGALSKSLDVTSLRRNLQRPELLATNFLSRPPPWPGRAVGGGHHPLRHGV